MEYALPGDEVSPPYQILLSIQTRGSPNRLGKEHEFQYERRRIAKGQVHCKRDSMLPQ